MTFLLKCYTILDSKKYFVSSLTVFFLFCKHVKKLCIKIKRKNLVQTERRLRNTLLSWLIITSCLTSKFQMFGPTSETLDRKSLYPAEGSSLDLQTSLQILGRGSSNQVSGQSFHKIWFLN